MLELDENYDIIKQKRKELISMEFKKKNKKVIIILVVCFTMLILGIIGYKLYIKLYPTPFDKLKFQMSRGSVHKQLGEPKYVSDDANKTETYNVKFKGADGILWIWYDDNDNVTLEPLMAKATRFLGTLLY